MACSVAQVYDLQPGPGLSYLDPYGDKQREKWQAFRAAMDALDLTGKQQDAIVAAAKRMFEGSIAMSRALADRFDLGDTPARATLPAHPID